MTKLPFLYYRWGARVYQVLDFYREQTSKTKKKVDTSRLVCRQIYYLTKFGWEPRVEKEIVAYIPGELQKLYSTYETFQSKEEMEGKIHKGVAMGSVQQVHQAPGE